MRYRILGRTGLFVSEIALGTNMFGGQSDRWKVMGNLDQGQANAVMKAALDAGINLFDTSNIYGEGDSERMIGQAMADLGVRRDSIYISSKIGLRSGAQPNQAGVSRATLYASLEASLRRLRTDYLDIYHIHCFDPLTPIDETLRALDDLIRMGKLRYIGCSNFAAWQVMKGLAASAVGRHARFESLQMCYTVAKRDIEREVLPMAIDQQLGVLVWGPLMGGLLTGKYPPAGGEGDAGRLARGANAWGDHGPAHRAVAAMRPIAERKSVSIATVALSWLLARPGISSLIVGASRPEQLWANAAATELSLDEEDIAAIAEVAPLAPEYPMDLQTLLLAGRPPGGPRP